MNLKPYKKLHDIHDKCVHFFNPDEMEIPEDMAPASLMYHVQEVATEEDSDYVVQPPSGRKIYYKYSSDSGREANTNRRTTDPNAVTNYDCLMALSREEFTVVYSLDEK